MLTKLTNGEYGLGATFWKFGVLGTAVFIFIIRVFGSLLSKHIGNLRLVDFYTRYFSPFKPDTMALLWTLCYLSSMGLFIGYMFMVIKGTWKAASAYERSSILRFLARMFILLIVLISVRIVFGSYL